MPSPIFFSRPSFSLQSIARGAQLTIVGVNRVLLNPQLPKHGFYKKAAIALMASILLQLVLWTPLFVIKSIGYILVHLSLIRQPEKITTFVSYVDFIQNNVLNVGHLFIALTRFLRSDLEQLFLMSLRWVDQTYKIKHPESDRQYYSRLVTFQPIPGMKKKSPIDVLNKYAKWSVTMLALYIASLLPIVGHAAFPLMSSYEISTVIGAPGAIPLFLLGLAVPKRYAVQFISAFWGSRNLVNELLWPYFRRIPVAQSKKARWYAARSGILFGFGTGFYLLMKIPFLGLFIYGLAQASAAYLLTKISDPPPTPDKLDMWIESQLLYQYNFRDRVNR